MTESWTAWQGQTINGTFALRRLLGQTDHSGVFLTDFPALALPDVAIKFIPATASNADTQLANWRKAAALPHPHLARILESGQCQQDGRPFLYVVTDYAEQSLEEILPHRPLTSDEVRAMLLPMLDALAFLHANQLIQGRLKPSNVLVIDDQVKLSSDTIQPTGAALPGIVRSGVYDAPETASGHRLPAGDMWALGVTIVQALTQHVPTWTDARPPNPVLPTDFPRDFIDVVLRCLNQNPTERPTPEELKAQISGEITAPLAVLPEPVAVAPEPPARRETVVSKKPARQEPVLTEPVRAEIVSRAVASATAPKASPETPKRSIRPLLAGAAIGSLVIWGWSQLFHRHRDPQPSAAAEVQPAPPAAQQPPTPTPAPSPSPPLEPDLAAGVLHQELPSVSRTANESIHGHLRVVVRVVVNRSGKVIDETLDDAGPSKYFARLASTAAREWKFAAADDHGTREWLLRFDFSKDHVSAKAEAAATAKPVSPASAAD
jgi:serine/threonine protein kinase